MTEQDYIEQVKKIRDNYDTQIKEIRDSYNEQLNFLNEKLSRIEQRMDDISKNNARFLEELPRQAEYYGVHHSEIELGDNHAFTVEDENGNSEKLRYNQDERKKLYAEKEDTIRMRNTLETFRKQELSQASKDLRNARQDAMNKKSALEQARKFLTYLDTSTTRGYDYTQFDSDDEIVAYYKVFENNKNKEGYRRVWDETMERMKKNDRDVEEFYISLLSNNNQKNGMNEEDAKYEAVKQFQEKYPSKEVPDAYTEYLRKDEPEMQGPPELFGPPTPEGMVENPKDSESSTIDTKSDENISNEEPTPKEFNNNSTVLLTEGQILALRNRGYNVPFNTPGQTRLTEEQIAAVNSAGISTVDLTEPGSKTVEELTDMPDPTQPVERPSLKKQKFNEEQDEVREYEEVQQPIEYSSETQELIDENEQILRDSSKHVK